MGNFHIIEESTWHGMRLSIWIVCTPTLIVQFNCEAAHLPTVQTLHLHPGLN